MFIVTDKAVSKDQIERYSENFRSDKRNIAMTNAVAKSGINEAAYSYEVPGRMPFRFSVELETMKVTNQKSSGRCWMFAALNVFRQKTAKSLKMEYFELSQSYMAFWDKFERVNYFLESILETLDEPIEGRLVCWILENSMNDGGQWDMLVNLVQKYGVVPKDAMPETFNSSSTGGINGLASAKLREYASRLRTMHAKGVLIGDLRNEKDRMLNEMYKMLCICYGEPPVRFDFEYRDKDKVFHCERDMTPFEFYDKFVGIPLEDYVSIINSPTKDKPFNRMYTVKYLGNVRGGKDVLYFNTDMNTMKSLAIAQLKDNEPVWFGCDIRLCDRKTGIVDTELYRYDLALDIPFNLTKAERLDYRFSCMTHAMVFTGVNLVDDGIPNRWKVENSWGEDSGEKGYLVMSDKWFDEYMYQVVVNKKYLPEEIRPLLEQKPIELNPWDPMGSLA